MRLAIDAQLRGLTPPTSSRSTFDAMISLDEKTLGAERRLISATRRHDEVAARASLSEASELNNQSNLLATRIGLTVCAERTSH